MAKARTQDQQRTYKTFRDPFGRKWGAHIESVTRMSTGRIEYLEHHEPNTQFPFYPPYLPEQKYLMESPESDQLGFDTARMKADASTAHREYEREAVRIGREIHKEAFDAGNPFTRDVLHVIGRAPDPIEPIVALEKGNPWVLGKTNTPDVRLLPFFVKPTNDIAAEVEDRYGDLGALVTGDDDQGEGDEFPVNYSPGRWRLSDGTKMQGSREQAVAAQEAMAATV